MKRKEINWRIGNKGKNKRRRGRRKEAMEI